MSASVGLSWLLLGLSSLVYLILVWCFLAKFESNSCLHEHTICLPYMRVCAIFVTLLFIALLLLPCYCFRYFFYAVIVTLFFLALLCLHYYCLRYYCYAILTSNLFNQSRKTNIESFRKNIQRNFPNFQNNKTSKQPSGDSFNLSKICFHTKSWWIQACFSCCKFSYWNT